MKTIPDFQLGLGHIVYALAKIDGRIQPEEMTLATSLLAEEPHGELAYFTFNLLEECDTPVEEAYEFAIRCFLRNRRMLDESAKKEYLTILRRVADAYDGVSHKEDALIQRFRSDLGQL